MWLGFSLQRFGTGAPLSSLAARGCRVDSYFLSTTMSCVKAFAITKMSRMVK